MNHFEVRDSLESMTLLVDTREQPTKRLEKRLNEIGWPYMREKLDYGDYSCKMILPNGSEFTMKDKVVIERKMNLDELCLCFGKERPRFEREFERAKAAGCRVYLLVEDGNWEKSFNGSYRSLLQPQALTASINAFRARYGMQVDFCKAETTGKLIREILWREAKEILTNMELSYES